MIPISRDSRIKHTFCGVTYTFLPPVGDTEMFLINSVKENYTIEQLREAYRLSKTDIDNELKGKRIPGKKQLEKLIEERMKIYLPKGEDLEEIPRTIDKILVGWDIKDVPFPDDNRPSQCMQLALMTEIFTWYWDQYKLDENELKN